MDGHIHQVQVVQAEVGSSSSWVQASADDCKLRIASECLAHAFFHDGLLPRFLCLTFSLSTHKSSVWKLKIRRQN